jgi:putative ABC transport system permease protein
MADGEWLDEARAGLPVVVLGSEAAERLGITDVGDGVQVWLGEQWFTVIGIMEPFELAPDLDTSAIIGRDIATAELGAAETPGTIYLRTDPDKVDDVQAVIAPTANPDNPDQVEVSRPSDAIEARAAASNAFTALFLGLGAVALLVGGVGIANVMVISVLERRSEIGLRRALGATRRHVSVQFLSEALLLSAAGGVAGVLLGAAVTAAYDMARGWDIVVPAIGLAGGLAAALAIGAVAGLYPATRAARLAPTDALRTV